MADPTPNRTIPGGVLRVAVPSPLRRLFDYLPLPDEDPPIRPGERVRVPFGPRSVVGVVVDVAAGSDVPGSRLRRIAQRIDRAPLVGDDEMRLIRWASAYYQHPIGEAIQAVFPLEVRRGGEPTAANERYWCITTDGRALDADALRRAPRRASLLERLREAGESGLAAADLQQEPGDWRGALRALVGHGWVEVRLRPAADGPGSPVARLDRHALNPEQQAARDTIVAARGTFAALLLDGVTGSGKTEVYLDAIERVIADGRQALLLVPEIGLTPQLVARVEGYLGQRVALYHSALNGRERLQAWRAARSGEAAVVIGTRSAVYLPLARPGLLVIDEEHDPSYKQQEGFRYHGRDVAIMRASLQQIPVVLGSATPSLESLHNVREGRYTELRLPQRAGAARPPRIELVDLRSQPQHGGLSPTLRAALDRELGAGHQALIFLNRRGFAPTLMCHACGWISECRNCDARMTIHARRGRLCCHHCGSERPVDPRCPDCGSEQLRALGQGTERVEEDLAARYGAHGVVRIDRDSTRRRGALAGKLASVHDGTNRLLVGTQMLAKGHHFPEVTLVGILNADGGLFSTDYRAAERVAQLIVQVAGRAGRAERPGRVLIQTHHPDHPLLLALLAHGYPAFADAALAEREGAMLPPFTHLALLRAEAVDEAMAMALLEEAIGVLPEALRGDVLLLGPVPAPMSRRGGRHRAQLLLQSARRGPLQRLLSDWIPRLESLPAARRARWSIDVDPIELY